MTRTVSERWREIQRLEAEAARLRRQADEDARKRQQRSEREFETETGIHVYASDDYAGLRIDNPGDGPPRAEFYYGYEETVPEHPGDDEDGEWAFVVRLDGQEMLRLATSEIHPKENEDVLFYLLVGIGHTIKRRLLTPSEVLRADFQGRSQ